MSRPLVSVIIPAYDAGSYLSEAIESVVQQSLADWELLLVDDCGPASPQATELSQMDPRLRLLRTPKNLGPSGARNLAIQQARGRFMAFLDSDDLWLPLKLERQVSHMLRYQASLSHTSYHMVGAKGSKLIQAPRHLSYRDLLGSNRIGCSTAMYDTESLGKRFFSLRGRGDYALWLSILRLGYTAHGLGTPLAVYRNRPGSFSADKTKAAMRTWQVYRECEELPWLESARHFGCYVARSLARYRLQFR